IRAGEPEIGITFHRMDAGLDTGAILAQRSLEVGEYVEPEEFYGRMGPPHLEAFGEALDRLAAADEDADLDLERPAAEVHRLVWAWRYTIPLGTRHGALLELDGETVRVLASSLTEV